MKIGMNLSPLSLTKSPIFAIDLLIAIFERSMGIYASLLIKVNSYHQPGLEAGNKAAASSHVRSIFSGIYLIISTKQVDIIGFRSWRAQLMLQTRPEGLDSGFANI